MSLKSNHLLLGLGGLFFAGACMIQRKNNNPKIYYKKRLFNNYNGYALPPFGIFNKNTKKTNDQTTTNPTTTKRESLIKRFPNYADAFQAFRNDEIEFYYNYVDVLSTNNQIKISLFLAKDGGFEKLNAIKDFYKSFGYDF